MDSDQQRAPATVRSVSVSFQQLCAFVAIRQTQSSDEVLRKLLLHCLELYPGETFDAIETFQALLDQRFGLQFTTSRVQSAVDGCIGRGELRRSRKGVYSLPPQVQQEIQRRVRTAGELETRVRDTWLREVHSVAPDVDPDCAWAALDRYMTGIFRQHGLQTMALIDQDVEVPAEFQASLRMMLADAVSSPCVGRDREALANLIELFFVGVSLHPDRVLYIVQLADSVVSYYSLTVPPDVADQLRQQLKPLILFLDTNVLFGLLDLDDGPQVEISHELVEVVAEYKLPFRIRYHSHTESELRKTLEAAIGRLLGRRWPSHISRAAAKLPQVSTIQRLYHERNASVSISPETFFAPFQHVDVLLREKGIQIYREPTDADRQPVYDLIADYETFLKRFEREKPYEARDHDMTLLQCVQRLRSKAESSLEAEALLVTYDFLLYKFDWDSSRRTRRLASTVLPSQLLQLLRPFIPLTPDFDRSFAETFAVPEFRAMGSKAHVAAAKMLDLLASYKGLSEGTATALLSNDFLLNGLQKAKSDQEIQEYVDSAIAAENALLAQEKTELADALQHERRVRDNEIAEKEALVRDKAERSAAELVQALAAARQSETTLSADLQLEKQRIELLERQHEEELRIRRAAEDQVAEAEKAAAELRKTLPNSDGKTISGERHAGSLPDF